MFRRLGAALAAIVCMTGGSSLAAAGQQAAPPPPSSPAAAQTPQTLPGGATQMQETHGDWRVTCVQPSGPKVCVLSQQQADQNSRQLVLGIELKATVADKAEGTLLLPFGLALEKPVTLQVDGGAPMTNRFRTCIPAGCLVSLTFDAATLSTLRKGKQLAVKMVGDGDKDVTLMVSLTGFASALDRTVVALSK